MNILGLFKKKSPTQKARETKIRRYGPKGISQQGLRKISRIHSKPQTKVYLEDRRFGVSYKPKKTGSYEYRGDFGAGLDFEGKKRNYLKKKIFAERGISSSKGLFARLGKKRIKVTASKNRGELIRVGLGQ